MWRHEAETLIYARLLVWSMSDSGAGTTVAVMVKGSMFIGAVAVYRLRRPKLFEQLCSVSFWCGERDGCRAGA